MLRMFAVRAPCAVFLLYKGSHLAPMHALLRGSLASFYSLNFAW